MELKAGPQGRFSVSVKTGGLLASVAQPHSGQRERGSGFGLIPVPVML